MPYATASIRTHLGKVCDGEDIADFIPAEEKNQLLRTPVRAGAQRFSAIFGVLRSDLSMNAQRFLAIFGVLRSHFSRSAQQLLEKLRYFGAHWAPHGQDSTTGGVKLLHFWCI